MEKTSLQSGAISNLDEELVPKSVCPNCVDMFNSIVMAECDDRNLAYEFWWRSFANQ